MFNKIILMGRLTADPELRQTPSNISVCRFTVACDRPYKSGEEKQADFINCTAWRASAEFVSKYFSKGKMVIVEGALHNNNYTDANGVKHYGMDVQVEKVGFGETKSASAASPVPDQKGNDSEIVVDLGDFEEILSDGDVPF